MRTERAETDGKAAASAFYENCRLCPRNCGIDRTKSNGFCGQGALPKIARAALHFWEEPALAGQGGSGAVFFSGCTLRCVFCQNYEISVGGFGKEIGTADLAAVFLRLQEEGAENLDLVTATQFIPSVLQALDLAGERLHIPVVWNSSGYERVESLRLLEGYIDIYLPDLKYFDEGLARRYSGAADYPETAFAAVAEMIRQRPGNVIIRHMVLPGHRDDSLRLLSEIAERFDPKDYKISLLSQYTPFFQAAPGESCRFPEISRRLTSFEYDSVVKKALELGMDGFMQEKSSAKEEYTPSFRLEGVP